MAKRIPSHLKLMAGPPTFAPSDPDPTKVWPGLVGVNSAGVEIALEIFKRLENSESDAHGIRLSDSACLEDWPREGRPFRNIVAEGLALARSEGPETEAGFCAALTDFVALVCSGRAALRMIQDHSPIGADSERYSVLLQKLNGHKGPARVPPWKPRQPA